MTAPINPDLTVKEVAAILEYRPESGTFFWKINAGGSAKVGTQAGTVRSDGYRMLRVKGCFVLAHRVAWLLCHSSFSTKELDHINGIRDDNRIDNLREVTRSENRQNLGSAHSGCAVPYLGVSFEKGSGKYVANIQIDGRQKKLGRFATAEAAHQAYLKAKKSIHTYNERALHHAAI